MRFLIETLHLDDTITQTVDFEMGGVHDNVHRRVTHLADQHVRDILIKAGWAPPGALEKQKADIADMLSKQCSWLSAVSAASLVLRFNPDAPQDPTRAG